jgi:hypothetical protein
MVGSQGLVHGPGEVSLEDAQRLAGALATLDAAGDELPGWMVAAGLGDGDSVDRRVELPVAGS